MCRGCAENGLVRERALDDARSVGSGMKRKLILTFWAIGSAGAVLWTCFWIFGVNTRKFAFGVSFDLAGSLLCVAGISIFPGREENAKLDSSDSPRIAPAS